MSVHRETSQLLAGAVSGFVATGVTAPLDLVKTVLQNSTKSVSSQRTLSVLRDVTRQEGFSACFKGLSPSLVGIAFQWACYFPVYDRLKAELGSHVSSPTALSMVSAMGAGATATVITNPFWLMKVRMQAYSKSVYPSFTGCARSIYATEGTRGFFKGVSVSLFGVLHVAVQFPAYEYLKTLRSGVEGESNALDIAFASAVSKGMASVTTYPLEVIRTRLQCQRSSSSSAMVAARSSPSMDISAYRGIYDVCKKIRTQEGYRAFYRGSCANMFRTIPASMITFGVYELISKHLDIERH